ncbi:hypothetical protein WN51_06484 [Melipona quadrifasciata]|uniref:Uncharacterized protein n=1 Tax=Melipona quadrifasciata TaxID=166423 RepID=A0A0M9AC15_9HYME|nr:hypothetical protein WN51_06484 [Melipona quadrifasciata]
MFILTFSSIVLILSRWKARCIVDGFNVNNNNWNPFLLVSRDLNDLPNYDITRWVRQLHLQQCAFVEIRGFCALFVELRSISSESKVLDNSGVAEFVLGICPCLILHTWDLCSPELTRFRKTDCSFNEATPHSNINGRVHRRLCDITWFVENASSCNCSSLLASRGRLYETKGFPTCFLNPLSESLYSPRGVCGIAQCTATTIKGIHIAQCASNCHQRQPFCEEIGPPTSVPAVINSLWTRRSFPKCNNTCRGFMTTTTSCQDQVTGKSAIDCIGLGSFWSVNVLSRKFVDRDERYENFSSCLDSFGNCYCEVNMRTIRITKPCISAKKCNIETFTFKDPSKSMDFDEAYENDERKRFEAFRFPESARVARRNLLQTFATYRQNGYVSCENRLANKNFKCNRGYRSILRSRLGDDAYTNENEDDNDDYDDDDEEEEGDDDENFDDDEDEEDEEDNDETIGLLRSAKGRRSPGKYIREARSDYAVNALEGKQEVDEPEKKGFVEIRSVKKDCEDESTEPLQYYEYESGGNISSDVHRVELILELIIMSILFWFVEY